MIIPVKSTEDNIFAQYLLIMNTFIVKSKKLTEQEAEVLGKLMQINNMYLHLPKEQRDMIIFNKLTREKIRISIGEGLKINQLENILCKIRAKNYISGKELKLHCPKIINGKIEINIKLEIKSDEVQPE